MTTKKISSKSETTIDEAASKWVNLVLAHVRAKRLGKKKIANINTKPKYATR